MAGDDNLIAGIHGAAQSTRDILNLILRERLRERSLRREREFRRIPVPRVEALTGVDTGLADEDFISPEEAPLLRLRPKKSDTLEIPVVTEEGLRDAARSGRTFSTRPIVAPELKGGTGADDGVELITPVQAEELRNRGVKLTSNRYKIVQASEGEKKRSGGEAELELNKEQDKFNYQEVVSKLERMKQEAEAIKNDVDLTYATDLQGVFLRRLPGSGGRRVGSRIETLRAKTGFSVLQAMREASKTGGALGQISNRENELLQAEISSLDELQSERDFKDSLDRIINYTNNAIKRYESRYRSTYEEDPPNTFNEPVPLGRNDVRRMRQRRQQRKQKKNKTGLESLSDEELLNMLNIPE